jgi:hypothetical protein
MTFSFRRKTSRSYGCMAYLCVLGGFEALSIFMERQGPVSSSQHAAVWGEQRCWDAWLAGRTSS